MSADTDAVFFIERQHIAVVFGGGIPIEILRLRHENSETQHRTAVRVDHDVRFECAVEIFLVIETREVIKRRIHSFLRIDDVRSHQILNSVGLDGSYRFLPIIAVRQPHVLVRVTVTKLAIVIHIDNSFCGKNPDGRPLRASCPHNY